MAADFESFAYEAYNRAHTWSFDAGIELHEQSHRECFIANSVATTVTVAPEG